MAKLFDITTVNCNGLAGKDKRERVLRWLRKRHKGILFLQETHTSPTTEYEWNLSITDFYQIYHSHGTTQSKGVSILLPLKFKDKVLSLESDKYGRWIILQLSINGKIYTLMNVYNYTQDKPADQISFIDEIEQVLQKYRNTILLLAGDWNIVQNPQLDKSNPVESEQPGKPAIRLEEFKLNFSLSDIWRQRNPKTRLYTWRRVGTNQQSRIDFWLANDSAAFGVSGCGIDLSFCSDHCPANITVIDSKAEKRGKGFWKMNNKLLEDEYYVFSIKNMLEDKMDEIRNISDERVAWDYTKMLLRKETIRYSVNNKKNKSLSYNYYKFELSRLDTLINNSQDFDTENLCKQRDSIQGELNRYEQELIQGSIVRSKIRWIEEGEKSSKFFLNLEKRNYDAKHIKSVCMDDGTVVTDPDQVLNCLYEFYDNLYTDNVCCEKEDMMAFTPDSELVDSDRILTDEKISLEECKEALDALPSGKTPGTDGLTKEVYKTFWKELSPILFKCFVKSVNEGQLSQDQRRAIISLIPKQDKDLRFIKNWRPISLLNVDYKVLAKLIAMRLKPLLPALINEDQRGYVTDRVIGENIRLIDDLMHCANAGLIEGILMLVDFEKAFDSLNWKFLNYTLNCFNFGPYFIGLVETLYDSISSSVINNGRTSKHIYLQRGIRQGCPASAYLFILCSELLSSFIRQDSTITGLHIGDTVHKVLQFADDTILLANDKKDIKRYLHVLKQFGEVSGLKVNKSKTELVYLSNTKHKENNLFGLSWCTGPFKYLGVWFSHDYGLQEYKNYRHRVDTITNLLKIWRQRDLSLKGKVIILRSLALSQLIYPMSLLELPKWVVDEVNALFFDFLWSGKPPKVRGDTVIKGIKEGGLKMVDLDSMARAVKTKWAVRLYRGCIQKWSTVPRLYFSELTMSDFIASSYHPNFIPHGIPPFYRQCLFSLSEVKPTELDANDIEGVRHQKLWCNRYILSKGKPFFNRKWYEKGLHKVTQLFDLSGNLLNVEVLFRKYNIDNNNLNVLLYYGLRDAIPRAWKKAIKDEITRADVHDNSTDLVIHCKGITRNALFVSNREFYWTYIDLKSKGRPASDFIWSYKYNIELTKVKKYYYIPYSCIIETKIQTLQFKIVHNILPTMLRKYQWRVSPSKECTRCGETDDISHHLYKCYEMEIFWSSLGKWWTTICTECVFVENECCVVLGSLDSMCHLEQRNAIILWSKWHIYRAKHLGQPVSAYNFMVELKNRIEIEERRFALKKEYAKFFEKWYHIQIEL
jgi:exonuclease III